MSLNLKFNLSLLGFSVFSLLLIIEHREVRLIATHSNVMLLKGLEHSATRLMGMGAVRETAVLREMEDILEIAGNLLRLHIERAKALDAWSVDEIRRSKGRGARGKR